MYKKMKCPSGAASMLWYRHPAKEWREALPLGNGKLAAMVHGGVRRETLQLNEDSIWAGPPLPRMPKNIKPHIDEARRLLFEGKYIEAQKLIAEEVRAEVRRRIDELATGGGYIPAPSHHVPYDPEIAVAMNDEIDRYGRVFYAKGEATR